MSERDESSSDVVGHKTFSDGSGGFRHEPLTRAEADALWEEAEREKQQRAEKFPTSEDAVRGLWDAYQRLQELGWKETAYSPTDGKLRRTISVGSTGIHKAYCEERPAGFKEKWWWCPSDGDLWPHNPILFWPDVQR